MSSAYKNTVLVVDDDREIVKGLCVRLNAGGFRPISACNGREGLDLLANRDVDLAIVDIAMPVLDGMAMLSEIRTHEKFGALPVIIVSASVSEKTRREAMSRGATNFVEKPYNPRALLQIVADCTARRRVADAAAI